MNRQKVNLMLLTGYIAFMVGLVCASVGEVPKTAGQPTSWYIPILMFLMMALPAWLGYEIGKDEHD